MIVIICGIDCCGKTSTINAIKEKINCKVIKRPKYLLPQSYPLFHEDEDKNTTISNYVLNATYNTLFETFKDDREIIIFDRFHDSQIVYSYKRRKDELMGYSLFWGVDEKISKVPHLLVYIEEEAGTIAERFKSRGEDYLKMSDIPLIQERYSKFLVNTKMNNVLILKKNTSIEERANKVIQRIRMLEELL